MRDRWPLDQLARSFFTIDFYYSPLDFVTPRAASLGGCQWTHIIIGPCCSEGLVDWVHDQ